MERRILVVEDSPTQAEHLRLLLEGEGYRVDLARNGREGLERVQHIRPDLIISDVIMPEMDGYAFLEAVKSDQSTKRVPFVLLTQRNTALDILMGMERGADNFIAKPFEDHYLLERVQRIFEHLDLRRRGHLEVDITLRLGKREVQITADKQQIIELFFSTFDEVCRLNRRLQESQRALNEYAYTLEAKVRERTQRLIQSEKLATMGELVAGVAHELNNPLSVLIGQATLLTMNVQGSPQAERAEKIAKAGERCARIVRNFLSLARQRPPERQRVALNQVIQDAMELVAYHLRLDNIEVTLDLAPDLPVLWADPNQLHQVVVNLVTNAHQAMRERPRPRMLTLTTRGDAEQARVSLEVADNGPGVEPAIQARIFEPFFTTKPPGAGTGLGLSLCLGIIEGHGGTITVRSRPGEGAVFRIELPLEAPPAVPPEVHAPEALLPIRGKAILVVDDEPLIAELLADTLATDDHQVEKSANGVMALERLHDRTYDLILSDVRMPELDGLGLYQEVERWHPALARRFIFVTGDELTGSTREALERIGAPSLMKPFMPAEVRRVTQQVLRLAERG